MGLHTKINYRERGGEVGLLIDLFHPIGQMSQSTRHLWSSRSEIMALDHRTFAEAHLKTLLPLRELALVEGYPDFFLSAAR